MARRKQSSSDLIKKFSRKDRALALQQQISSKFKHAMITSGGEIEAPFAVMRRPSGLLSLDIATGGGIPAGGVTEIIGANSSGKSTLLNQYMAMQQAIQGDDCTLAMGMTETRYDKGHARFNCGMRIALNALEIASFVKSRRGRELTQEDLDDLSTEIGIFQEVTGATAEHLYDVLLELVASRCYDIVGVDSWGALLTQDADEGSMSDRHYGGSAGLNTRFATKLSTHFSVAQHLENDEGKVVPMMNYTSLIGINHYREKIGNVNAKAGELGRMNIQGGHALKHAKLLSIYLEGSGLWEKHAGGNRLVGKKVNWKVIKGKCGCSDGASGTFHILFGKGLDVVGENIDAAVQYGAIRVAGSWYTLLDQDDNAVQDGGSDLKAQGKAKLKEIIQGSPALLEVLREGTILRAIDAGHSLITNYVQPPGTL